MMENFSICLAGYFVVKGYYAYLLSSLLLAYHLAHL